MIIIINTNDKGDILRAYNQQSLGLLSKQEVESLAEALIGFSAKHEENMSRRQKKQLKRELSEQLNEQVSIPETKFQETLEYVEQVSPVTIPTPTHKGTKLNDDKELKIDRTGEEIKVTIVRKKAENFTAKERKWLNMFDDYGGMATAIYIAKEQELNGWTEGMAVLNSLVQRAKLEADGLI